MLARLLNYYARETILRIACECRDIQYNGARVSFYSDFSAEVQRSRAKFTDVCKRLQRLQATYVMLYPARLCITAGGQAHFLNFTASASNWIDTHEVDLRCRPDAADGD